MQESNERRLNQEAYRQVRETIKRTYPPDRFVAISGGKIVANAASFPEIEATLKSMGIESKDTLVVQAGQEYLDYAVILFHHPSCTTKSIA
jgi:hypothetical protein